MLFPFPVVFHAVVFLPLQNCSRCYFTTAVLPFFSATICPLMILPTSRVNFNHILLWNYPVFPLRPHSHWHLTVSRECPDSSNLPNAHGCSLSHSPLLLSLNLESDWQVFTLFQVRPTAPTFLSPFHPFCPIYSEFFWRWLGYHVFGWFEVMA